MQLLVTIWNCARGGWLAHYDHYSDIVNYYLRSLSQISRLAHLSSSITFRILHIYFLQPLNTSDSPRSAWSTFLLPKELGSGHLLPLRDLISKASTMPWKTMPAENPLKDALDKVTGNLQFQWKSRELNANDKRYWKWACKLLDPSSNLRHCSSETHQGRRENRKCHQPKRGGW